MVEVEDAEVGHLDAKVGRELEETSGREDEVLQVQKSAGGFQGRNLVLRELKDSGLLSAMDIEF